MNKNKFYKEVILKYYNDYLYKIGLITQDEYLKMSNKILEYVNRL